MSLPESEFLEEFRSVVQYLVLDQGISIGGLDLAMCQEGSWYSSYYAKHLLSFLKQYPINISFCGGCRYPYVAIRRIPNVHVVQIASLVDMEVLDLVALLAGISSSFEVPHIPRVKHVVLVTHRLCEPCILASYAIGVLARHGIKATVIDLETLDIVKKFEIEVPCIYREGECYPIEAESDDLRKYVEEVSQQIDRVLRG